MQHTVNPMEVSRQWWDYLHDHALQSAKDGRIHDVYLFVNEMRKLEALARRIKQGQSE